MAQGKAYTTEEKNNIIESLRPYYELNYNTKKAYMLAFSSLREKLKENIPDYTTIAKWIQEDDFLSIKIQAWQNIISEEARTNWRNKIKNDNDYQASKEWLERREREDFSTRSELTSPPGQPLEVKLDNVQDENRHKIEMEELKQKYEKELKEKFKDLEEKK